MVTLNLNRDEQTMLGDILEYELKDLRNEISNTENWEFKAGLKKREELLKKVLAILKKETADLNVDVVL